MWIFFLFGEKGFKFRAFASTAEAASEKWSVKTRLFISDLKKWDKKPCFYTSFHWWTFCDRSESSEFKTLFSEDKNVCMLI